MPASAQNPVPMAATPLIATALKDVAATGVSRMSVLLAMRPDQDDRVNCNWRAGYLASQSLWGPDEAVPVLMEGEWSRAAFTRWLRRHRPDVVITIGTDVAGWLADLGLEPPADLGLANVDLPPTMGGMTAIKQNLRLAGVAALDLLGRLCDTTNVARRGFCALSWLRGIL